MRNHSYDNDFELHENKTASRTHFHMKGFALRLVFETEVQENSEMAYRSFLGMDLEAQYLRLHCNLYPERHCKGQK